MEELQQTVVMLEHILEVMPGDLFTLRSLFETLLKLEELEKAFDCLSRLDDGARAAQNEEMIEFVLNQYLSIVEDMPDVQKRIERLRAFQGVAAQIGEQVPDLPSGGRDIDSEMALAWDLLQDDQLSQEEYSALVRDLTEMSSAQMGVPVTVLHVLSDQGFSRFERLLAHLSVKSNVPAIDMSRFEENEEVKTSFSDDFLRRHAVLPFAQVGGDLLLGVLNPFNRRVIELAEEHSGRRCHPYLVAPQDYDQRLAGSKKQ